MLRDLSRSSGTKQTLVLTMYAQVSFVDLSQHAARAIDSTATRAIYGGRTVTVWQTFAPIARYITYCSLGKVTIMTNLSLFE